MRLNPFNIYATNMCKKILWSNELNAKPFDLHANCYMWQKAKHTISMVKYIGGSSCCGDAFHHKGERDLSEDEAKYRRISEGNMLEAEKR